MAMYGHRNRTIVAIRLDKDDPSWYNGPPYAIAESTFDEYDIEGCCPTKEIRDLNMARMISHNHSAVSIAEIPKMSRRDEPLGASSVPVDVTNLPKARVFLSR